MFWPFGHLYATPCRPPRRTAPAKAQGPCPFLMAYRIILFMFLDSDKELIIREEEVIIVHTLVDAVCSFPECLSPYIHSLNERSTFSDLVNLLQKNLERRCKLKFDPLRSCRDIASASVAGQSSENSRNPLRTPCTAPTPTFIGRKRTAVIRPAAIFLLKEFSCSSTIPVSLLA